MKFFLKKIIFALIIISLVFGLAQGKFVKKADAAGADLGSVIGQAAGAGVACYVTSWASRKITEWAATLFSEAESSAKKVLPSGLVSVPVNVDASISTNKSAQDALSDGKKCIRDVVVKQIMDWLVDQIVDWIQNGGNLGDRFVTNWDTFSKNAWNAGVGAVVNDSTFSWLCSPFRAQVKLAFLPVEKFHKRIACTLDKIQGNIDAFKADFNNGGWLAYNTMWEPQNNYFGSILLINNEAITKAAENKDAKEKEAAAGGGFLSDKGCKVGTEVNVRNLKIGELTSEEISLLSNEEIAKEYGLVKDPRDNYCLPENLENKTPGRIVGDMAYKVVDKDFQAFNNIASSDDIGRWITAIVNASTNRLMKEGLGALRQSNSPSSSAENRQISGFQNSYQQAISGSETIDSYLAGQSGNMTAEFAQTKVVNKINDILPTKQKSLTSATSTLAMLSVMRTNNCSTDVTIEPANEITGAGAEIVTMNQIFATSTILQNEVNSLTDILSKAQDFINQANTSSTTSATSTNQNIQEFYDALNGSDIYQKIFSGNYAAEAQTELANLTFINNKTKIARDACVKAIVINSGAASTYSIYVNLTLDSSKTGISNANQMMISNDSVFSSGSTGTGSAIWESYSTSNLISKSWTLTGSGTKTVYVKFKNASGDVSDVYSDSINLTTYGD